MDPSAPEGSPAPVSETTAEGEAPAAGQGQRPAGSEAHVPPAVPSAPASHTGRHPQAPGRGVGLSFPAFVAILLGLAGLTFGLASLGVTLYLLRSRGPADGAGPVANAGEAEKKKELPSVTRHVPVHSLRLLEGCSDRNLATLTEAIENAIDIGSPEYNEGDFLACYRTYVGAALELEKALPDTCSGPARALAAGRHNASGLTQASAQAWAMRDAFDGILDVIARSQHSGGATNL